MGQALTLNSGLSDATPPLSLTAQDISNLNDTIADNDIEPAVVLNENLLADTTLNYTPSTLAVGDSAATGTRAVNFYILLDGKITLIGSNTLTNSNPDYISYADVVNEYRDAVITGLTTSNINSTYYFRYNTNGSVSATSGFNTNATYSNSRVRFGNTSSARYAILCTRSGSTWNPTYTPVEFFTVTLDYSNSGTDTARQTVYVQSGQTSGLTLDDAYLWYDASGNLVTAMPTTITETTTLYAHPKEYTAVFRDENGDQLGPSYTGMPLIGCISIPSVDIRLPVLNDWSEEMLKAAPCRYQGSVSGGNMIIMGHNYKSHFTPLQKIEVGAEVQFENAVGKVFCYRVAEIEYLHRSEGEKLPSDYPLTVFTCTPGGLERIVVRCEAV